MRTFIIFIELDIGDGITTICSLLLLASYKTIHYLIRYRYCQMNSRHDFLISTVRRRIFALFCFESIKIQIQLTGIFVFAITFIFWTYLLVRTSHYEKKVQQYARDFSIFFMTLTRDFLKDKSSKNILFITQSQFDVSSK